MKTKSNLSLILNSTLLAAAGLLAAGLLHAEPLIYDGFAYETGSVAGGAGGTGFTGAWSVLNAASLVATPGLSWGSLPVAGNSVTNTSGGSAARDIGATSVLDDGSLMGNGDTLWFSLVMKNASIAIANVDLNFSLGSDSFLDFVPGPGGTFSKRTHLASGEGIGFSLRNVNSTTGRANGAYWQDTDADTIANRVQIDTSTSIGLDQTILIVGRIDWGADDVSDETLTLYAPDTDLNLGTAILDAAVVPALDQSAFDTVAFQLKGDAFIDEIHFGATSDDVLSAPAAESADPQITSITSVGANLWELTLKGDVSTAYSFYSSATLEFTPGTLIENLVQGDPGDAGTVGGTNDSVLTTDANGDGKVRVTLTGSPRDFVRAQSVP